MKALMSERLILRDASGSDLRMRPFTLVGLRLFGGEVRDLSGIADFENNDRAKVRR